MKALLTIILLTVLLPSGVQAGSPDDSLVLARVFSFKISGSHTVDGFHSNVYIKHLYQTHRRNFTLWAVPSMYAIARGQREFVSEEYSRLTWDSTGHHRNISQVYYTTIPHDRRTMSTLLDFITPSLYDETIYGDHILSPFHRTNLPFYRYFTSWLDERYARLYFRPRYVTNTQLVQGQATVDTHTGRILEAEINGEFDMLHFQTLTSQGDAGSRALIPKFCRTNVDFRFLGNHITSSFEAAYDCPLTLPDTVNVSGDRQLMDSIRPYSLSPEEQAIYSYRDSLLSVRSHQADSSQTDTLTHSPLPRRHNYWKEIGWYMVGENLIRSLRASSDVGYVRLSPLLNPEYISYSRHKGLSYRMRLGAQLNLGDHSSLSLNTRFGYNFKQRKFYFNLPLRYNYVFRDREAYTEATWANGNRISTNTIIDEIKETHGDVPGLDEMELDKFDDWYLRITNTLPLNSRTAIEAGLVLHQRKAVNDDMLSQFGLPSAYHSLAPSVCLKVRPWLRGPLFTVDYERGLGCKKDYLTYERWEIDASLKHRLHRLQTLNLRFGTGFYTERSRNMFMDFANFRDENLPEGWDDDWSGNFQLLDSRLYNASNYYLRGNVSFESPLMAASFVPWAGRYVERERIYLSTLSIAHTRLYSEVGYGFTCRYFSVGAFASFLGTKFQESGAKFTFELFRRW